MPEEADDGTLIDSVGSVLYEPLWPRSDPVSDVTVPVRVDMIDVMFAADSRSGVMPSCCATAEMTAFWSSRPALTSCVAVSPPKVVLSALTRAADAGFCAVPLISTLLVGLG